MNAWIDCFNLPVTLVENEATKEIIAKFDGFVKWAKELTEKM